MKVKIPFSLIPFRILKRLSSRFFGIGSKVARHFPLVSLYLEKAEMNISVQEYFAMCITSALSFFLFNFLFFSLILYSILKYSFVVSFFVSFVLTLFIFTQQIFYPKLVANRKIKDIERNLIPVLQYILIQLSSGIPLFTIFVNISREDYGAISKEFQKAVKKINAGIPQTEVLDTLAEENPSLYFRRAIWQLTNGLKTGSDTAGVVKEVIAAISEEQLVQVQRYG